MEQPPHEREHYRIRNKLLNLSVRCDPYWGKYDELVAREIMKKVSEQTLMSDEKRTMCVRLASCAWQSIHDRSYKLSCVKIALTLDRIYQSATAVEFYAQLLCQIIASLCIEQARQVDQRIQQSIDVQLLDQSWYKHNADLKFILDFFVPNNIQGEGIREKLKKAAIIAYRKTVITGSNLQADVLKRFEMGRMSRDEQIAAIQVLNAIEEQFFEVHLNSTLVKLTQFVEQSLHNGFTTAQLVFETVQWLDQEMKMFAIITSDPLQTHLFMKTIREHIVKNLLVKHLVHEGNFFALINNKQFDALRQLYSLFEGVEDGSTELIELIANFIRQKKQARNAKASSNPGSPKSPNRMPHSVMIVNDFLVFKSLLFSSILNDCFHGDALYRAQIELELQRLISTQEHFPQYLAFYIDYQMKRRQHEEVSRAADLLHYIEDQDNSFEQYYRNHLAGRLINGTPSDLSTEKMLIDRFKSEKGVVFVHKMERMIADVNCSRVLLSEFVKELNHNEDASVNVAEEPPPVIQGVQFTATILTENFWPPHYRPTVCRLPTHVSSLFASFEQFYLAKHSNRKLQLNSGAGSAVVDGRFHGSVALKETQNRIALKDQSPISSEQLGRIVTKKTFVVSPVQLTVLDLFNSRSFVTVQDLLALEFPLKSLQRGISAMTKQHVICRQGDTTSADFSASSTDVYFINDEFHSRKAVVNLRKYS